MPGQKAGGDTRLPHLLYTQAALEKGMPINNRKKMKSRD